MTVPCCERGFEVHENSRGPFSSNGRDRGRQADPRVRPASNILACKSQKARTQRGSPSARGTGAGARRGWPHLRRAASKPGRLYTQAQTAVQAKGAAQAVQPLPQPGSARLFTHTGARPRSARHSLCAAFRHVHPAHFLAPRLCRPAPQGCADAVGRGAPSGPSKGAAWRGGCALGSRPAAASLLVEVLLHGRAQLLDLALQLGVLLRSHGSVGQGCVVARQPSLRCGTQMQECCRFVAAPS